MLNSTRNDFVTRPIQRAAINVTLDHNSNHPKSENLSKNLAFFCVIIIRWSTAPAVVNAFYSATKNQISKCFFCIFVSLIVS